MSIFRIVDDRSHVVAETDDWVEAESRAATQNWPKRYGGRLSIRGTHPTHDWYRPEPDPGNPDHSRRCRDCDGWDNGSYGSHAPCGYDFRGRALVTALRDEIAARADQHSDSEPMARAERADTEGPNDD